MGINSEVFRILVEKVDGKNITIRLRMRGDRNWYFDKFTLHEGDSITIQDNQKIDNSYWSEETCVVPRRMID